MTEYDYDYEDLGLVAGLEIHQQLDTETKLFCGCPTDLREPDEATAPLPASASDKERTRGDDEAALEEAW